MQKPTISFNFPLIFNQFWSGKRAPCWLAQYSSQHLSWNVMQQPRLSSVWQQRKTDGCSSRRKSLTAASLKCEKTKRLDEMSVGETLKKKRTRARRVVSLLFAFVIYYWIMLTDEKTRGCASNLFPLLICSIQSISCLLSQAAHTLWSARILSQNQTSQSLIFLFITSGFRVFIHVDLQARLWCSRHSATLFSDWLRPIQR